MPTGIGVGITGKVFGSQTGSSTPSYSCPTVASLEFDGLTEYGERNALSDGSPQLGVGGTGSFTMCFWIKTPTLSNQYIAKGVQTPAPSAPDANQWSLRWLGSGRISLRSTGSANPSGNLDALSDVVSAGAWHLVALVYDNTAKTVLWNVDGIQSGSTTSTTNRDIVLNSLSLLYLGRDASGSYFNGNMCHFAVFNQALTASELIELRDNSAGKCYNNDFSFSSSLSYYLPMFNPSGVYTDPLTETVGGKDIPLLNMSATNVSSDYPSTL